MERYPSIKLSQKQGFNNGNLQTQEKHTSQSKMKLTTKQYLTIAAKGMLL